LTRLLDRQIKSFSAISIVSTEEDSNIWITHIDDELRDFVIASGIDKRTIDSLKMR
jgi:hypothetical protein